MRNLTWTFLLAAMTAGCLVDVKLDDSGFEADASAHRLCRPQRGLYRLHLRHCRLHYRRLCSLCRLKRHLCRNHGC